MSRARPHLFSPEKLHRVEITDAIRGMTEKKCSVYIVFLEVVQHGPTTVILVTPPRASLIMKDGKLYCEFCRKFVDHKSSRNVKRHLKSQKHLKTVRGTTPDPVAAAGS